MKLETSEAKYKCKSYFGDTPAQFVFYIVGKSTLRYTKLSGGKPLTYSITWTRVRRRPLPAYSLPELLLRVVFPVVEGPTENLAQSFTSWLLC